MAFLASFSQFFLQDFLTIMAISGLFRLFRVILNKKYNFYQKMMLKTIGFKLVTLNYESPTLTTRLIKTYNADFYFYREYII